jgi:hypothetical protein
VPDVGRAVQKGFRVLQPPAQLDEPTQILWHCRILRILPSGQILFASGETLSRIVLIRKKRILFLKYQF